MKALEDKILKEGQVFPGNILKVNGFLNQRIDIDFLKEMGSEISRLYKNDGVTKILTVEASGIAVAVAAAYEMGVPVVFAKKGSNKNLSDDVYKAEVQSFTKGTKCTVSVEAEFIDADDRVLLIDDFLADGNALKGLLSIINQAGAKAAGAAIVIEKGFQKGGEELRKQGLRIESLAIVDEMTDDGIKFRSQNQV